MTSGSAPATAFRRAFVAPSGARSSSSTRTSASPAWLRSPTQRTCSRASRRSASPSPRSPSWWS
eukprot:14511359-Alexandrium_andersonii.AAC.1